VFNKVQLNQQHLWHFAQDIISTCQCLKKQKSTLW